MLECLAADAVIRSIASFSIADLRLLNNERLRQVTGPATSGVSYIS